MKDDDLVSAALLYDVCKDCEVEVEDLSVNEENYEAVRPLTMNSRGGGYKRK